MTPASLSTTVDVRTIEPRDRHPLIFSTFRELGVGEAMELVNDHDPRPLYYQFQAEMPGSFSWTYLEQGPELFRVAIARTGAPAVARDPCCGACGGA